MQVSDIVQLIQYTLAPAVMVSSAALLLLGFQNKFSNIASRFRAMSHEKRSLVKTVNLLPDDAKRVKSLEAQLAGLLKRAHYLRNAILCAYLGIICFTGTSLLIFINAIFSVGFLQAGVVIFGIGFIFIFASSLFMIKETRMIYRIMKLEHHS